MSHPVNPWHSACQAPECPRCEVASTVYLWAFGEDRWYCSSCMKIFEMPDGEEIGGQGTLC